VSMEPWFSSGKWLLYAEIKDLEHFFLGIDVPFNSEMLVVLRTKYGVELKELYRARSILPLQICHFGSWNKSCGFEGPDLEFRDRRNNLHGLAMKTESVHFPPLSTRKGKYELGGFVGETWHILERVLNFTSEFVSLSDISWGVPLSNGSWTGLVGAVQRNQIDVVVALLTLSSQRSEVADFSITWSDLK
ncbi:unnamed protein product, partial [Timema podura]|nr:unnamed protein product [Timema podura]